MTTKTTTARLERLISPREIEEAWGVSRGKIQEMIRTGELEPVRLGRLGRFRLDDVERLARR